MREQLIQPIHTIHGIPFFDFQQVTGLKTLCDLTQAGVKPERITRSLQQLAAWMPRADYPLTQLGMIERDGKILFRLGERLAEASGQLQFDFSEPSRPAVVERPAEERSAQEWWQLGTAAEESGRLPQAAHAYRQALRAGGPQALLCFNLANVLYARGDKTAAAERFAQAVELDPNFAEGWNNLGIALSALEQKSEAVEAFQQALRLQPHYADAQFNLADTFDEMGQTQQAHVSWKAFVQLNPTGPWADYARRKLNRIPG
jgi:tetratricopeptide (TPR) repeat protein